MSAISTSLAELNREQAKRLWGAVVVFVISAVIISWPLALHLDSAVPLGSESVGTVPFLNVWTLELNIEKMTGGSADYWDAPIFFPHEGAFAFSDPQPLGGFLSLILPGQGLGVQYSAVLLTYLFLNGLAAYLLLWSLTRSAVPALLAGLWMQLLPFLSHERGVLQLQPLFVVLLVAAGCVALSQKARLSISVLTGGALALASFFSLYYGLLAFMVFFSWLPFAVHKQPKALLYWLLPVFLALMIALPFLLGQNAILAQYDFGRSLNSVTGGSARLEDYASPSQTLLFFSLLSGERSRFGVYPGLLLALFAGAGSVLLWRRRRFPGSVAPFLFSGAAAFLLSLGLNLRVFGVQPYYWLWKYLPGFSHMRSPFRFGVWVQACLVILAALVVYRVWQSQRSVWLAAIVLLITAELWPAPARLAPLPDIPTFQNVTSPAVFVPYVSGTSPAAYLQTSRWMLVAQQNDLTIANGYSGYFPATSRKLKDVMGGFPSQSTILLLDELGIRSILIPEDWITPEREAALEQLITEGLISEKEVQSGFAIFQIPR